MDDEKLEDWRIVRRRRLAEDEDYHGGVWKLAFADFMTAMMAFFLVMWLINSTTKENRAAIVQYFNPVHLIDASAAHKGLRDPKDVKLDDSVKETDGGANLARSDQRFVELNTRTVEEELHRAPFRTLERIANANREPVAEEASPGAPTGRAFNDPFDRTNGDVSREPPTQGLGHFTRHSAGDGYIAPSPSATQTNRAAGNADQGENVGDKQTVAEITAALKEIVKKEVRSNAPHIEAVQTDEGTLISLADDANFSMFAIGSIEPRPQLVRILGRVGRLIAEKKGEVEIRGHTDGRSYKSQTYDNWRLSADRANIVRYMLLRGGLPTARIFKISGVADTRLKDAKDPYAAANRRIEILLREKLH
jgi:chemotaxis protein MotB